jgi:thiol-disulfide isomerase/thioredoxin
MTTTSKILTVLFVFLGVTAASSANSSKTATLYGTIEKGNGDLVTLIKNTWYLDKYSEAQTATIKESKYSLTMALDHSRLLKLSLKNKFVFLYVEPGDSINVSFDALTFPSGIKFSGKGGANNSFLIQFNETFKIATDKNALTVCIQSSAVDAYENNLFSEKKKEETYFDNYQNKAQLSTGFKTYVKQVIQYSYLNALLAYPIINANNNKGLTVTPLPNIMLEHFDKNTASNDSALTVDAYRSFLNYFVTYFVSEGNGFNKFTDLTISMQKKYYFANQYLKNESFRFFLARYLMDECERTSPETVKKIFNVLAWADNGGTYSKIVKEHCNKFTEAKSPSDAGQAPVLKLKDLKGKSKALTDFKGKVVYIDFWASWCGPCRQQFPYAHELKKQLSPAENKQIEFVYFSIYNTDSIWKKAIIANGLEGTQLFSPGGWNSEVVKYFKINGIPRYMLLNKKGQIADPNAKRPSDPQILDDLRKLML